MLPLHAPPLFSVLRGDAGRPARVGCRRRLLGAADSGGWQTSRRGLQPSRASMEGEIITRSPKAAFACVRRQAPVARTLHPARLVTSRQAAGFTRARPGPIQRSAAEASRRHAGTPGAAPVHVGRSSPAASPTPRAPTAPATARARTGMCHRRHAWRPLRRRHPELEPAVQGHSDTRLRT